MDSPANTYSAGKPLGGHARQFSGKRLDYVLYRPPAIRCADPKLRFLNWCRATSCLPYSFSDNFGLEVNFSIHLPQGQPGDVNEPSDIEVPAPAPNTITHNRPPGAKSDPSQQVSSLPNIGVNPPPGLSDASATTLIQALTASYRISRSNQRVYFTIFFVSLSLSVPHGCWINFSYDGAGMVGHDDVIRWVPLL